MAEQRAVGLGHGNLGAMLLRDETNASPSWPATSPLPPPRAPSASPAPPTRPARKPLRVILNGLGKDAAYIISRINGFTYVETDYDFKTGELKVVREKAFSDGERAAVKCYGANDVLEGVAIMKKEGVEVPSPATLPTPPASSTWLPAPIKNGRWRTAKNTSPWPPAAAPAARCTRQLAAGPASYGLTDSMGRMSYHTTKPPEGTV